MAGCMVGLFEIGLRLAGVEPAYLTTRLSRWQTHPGLDNHRMLGSREPHDFIMSTNADGLRTQLEIERDGDIPRVAVMGDSNVFGWGLSNAEALSAQTKDRLAGQGHTIEIINAGQPGYSTAQASWLYQETLAKYTPDLTIVFLSMHDHNRALVSDSEIWRGARGPSASIRVLLAKHSRIYQWMREQIYTEHAQPQLMPDDTSEGARVPRVSANERALRLAEMQTMADAWGGKIALGLMPDFSDLLLPEGNHYPSRIGQDWAQDWSEQAGLPLFNIRPCCSGSGEQYVFPFDHGHMNAQGNAAASHSLADQLSTYLELAPQTQGSPGR
jgi:lysophospholipase L1-like esterase